VTSFPSPSTSRRLILQARDVVPPNTLPPFDCVRTTIIAALQQSWFPGVDAYDRLPATLIDFPRSTFGPYSPGPSDAAAYGYTIWQGSADPSSETETQLLDEAVSIVSKDGFNFTMPTVNPLHGLPPEQAPEKTTHLPGHTRVVAPPHHLRVGQADGPIGSEAVEESCSRRRCCIASCSSSPLCADPKRRHI
jgi:hypothetical protein